MRTSPRLRGLVAITVLGLSLATPASGSAAPAMHCADSRQHVALAPGLPADEVVWGRLCEPAGRPVRAVQLLISGSTYGHLYWDFPYRPEMYSYVRALASAGYATFNYDRIGVGRSSYPPSPLVTIDTDAYVAHQIVHRLRSGRIARFKKVVTVGHSHGSIVALVEAQRFADVDGLLLTGLLHSPNLDALLLAIAQNIEPAMLDPRFADREMDAGYITYRAPFRRVWIHDASDDPRLIALDEATKETQSGSDEASEFEFGLDAANAAATPIRVPVLIAVGRGDKLFCDGVGGTDCSNVATVRAAEAQYFTEAPALDVFVLPGAGHAINLSRRASAWFARSVQWMGSRVS